MLAFLTGPVRSGKSQAALALALDSGAPVVIAVGGRTDDPEMTRRIERHRATRSDRVRVVETAGRADWLAEVPADACLLVDCLGTVLGGSLVDGPSRLANETSSGPEAETVVATAEAEAHAYEAADALVEALLARAGHTVVVSNEVGWGVVPPYPLGRLFRDALGRANRRLTEAADAAWLVVGGRCIDLTRAPREVMWPR